MAGSGLRETLQHYSLEKYYNTFTSVGIDDIGGLLALTMQDYPALGITSMQDRRKMFHLIQNVKDKSSINRKDTDVVSNESSSAGQQSVTKKPKEQEIKSRKESQPLRPESTHPSGTILREYTTHDFSYGIPSSKVKPKTPSRPRANSENSKIKVCVRKRPLGGEEVESGETDVVDTVPSKSMVVISAPKVAVDLTKYIQKFSFAFDEVFDENTTNRQVYEKTCKPLVNEIFTKGIKATCFAYGCTGSGKTYTMLGTDNIPGLYLLAASDIFSILYSGNHGNDLGLWVSFYEIYCGQLFDLLNERSKLFARENAAHQVCIVGLTEKHVTNVEELMEVIESGGNSRSTGSTGVNADSSRSHAILQLDLKDSEYGETLGRFSFIDLAGSERAADVTDSDKQTRMEGAEINQSLLALKECIRALDQDSRHTPFRQSKLTQVLKDSFVGNTKTCMIANISPCSSSSENTLNTLRYSDRVKELNKNEAVINTSPRPVTVHGNDSEKWIENQKYSPRNMNSLMKIKEQQTSKKSLVKPRSSDHFNLIPNNKLNVNILQVGNLTTNKPKTPQLNTKNKKARNQSTLIKSLEPLPSKFVRNTLEKPRPDTSPAVINVPREQKPRPTRRLQYVHKEQYQNTSKEEKYEETIESNIMEEKPKRQIKSRLSDKRSNRNTQSSLSEKPTENLSISTHNLVSQNLDVLRTSVNQQLTVPVSSHYGERAKQSISSAKPKISHNEQKPVDSVGTLEPNKTDGTPNNRYSRGIKAKLAQLFNSKPTTSSTEILPDHKQLSSTSSSVRSKRALQPIQQTVSPRVITEDQIVAAHHTQLAMVTGLCHEEMILLKERDNNKQDFKEYAFQLEEILLQKQACIENLQEKLKKWKTTMQ
ncbi:kinesin-like protein KIF24 [Actinia tenebrosa]|uniref:Kinesin-like protein n=1 Tax=Actinia tenebrosa TaxID=6105 RepID=A0A6P8I8Z1_ACTTE|nr:kinesin-like protein KIF24 [Actinia tenebrosa]